MGSQDKLLELVISKQELGKLRLYQRPKTIAKKPNETELEWFARRTNHYKRLWIAAYRFLTDEEKRLARQEVMAMESAPTTTNQKEGGAK